MKTFLVRGVPTARDQGAFVPRRSNLWAVRLGYWLGRGHSAKDVAAILGEGTSEGTVKGQARKAGIRPARPRMLTVPVEMPSWHRDIIVRHAAHRGLTLQEIIAHVLETTLVIDDLYDAVTDGRYAVKGPK